VTRPFGPIVAERNLVAFNHEGERVRVTLGMPRWNRREWECPFRIRGAGVSEVEFGYGVDSMQALTTALEGIRFVLDKKFGSLGWEDVLPDDSGFQRLIPITFGKAFSKRLERLVDGECRRHLRQLEQLGANRRAAARKRPMKRA
jgi:Domain of unknown function (DUF6968)